MLQPVVQLHYVQLQTKDLACRKYHFSCSSLRKSPTNTSNLHLHMHNTLSGLYLLVTASFLASG
jgi:hypothetical protein